ncbi:MAG: hypothetical protein SGBAC_002251 [Bacillariaceae sp.]
MHTDAGGPKVGSDKADSLSIPALEDLYKGDSVDHGTARKMGATEMKESDKRNPTDGPTTPKKKLIYVFQNTTEDDTLPLPAMAASNPSDLKPRNAANERMAIVLRSMDPIRSAVLNRLIQIAEIFQKDEFKDYDFHIMIDQTKTKTTTTKTLQRYFRAQNASHLKPPTVFSVTEQMILEEFPKLATGYVPGPLVDGGKGTCCGQPLLWQLLIPTFVTFVHYHQEYDYNWVLEDDIWTVGTPIVELIRAWDDKLKGKNASLCGSRLGTNGIPYSRMTKERHTYGFRDILMAMKATGWQHRNRTLLKMDGQVRSHVWNEWGGNRLPIWSCMSDTLYRHSRDFGNYVYRMVKSNVYQFAECYQMPLAWHGGFQIADIKKILPNIEDDYKDGRSDEPAIHVKWEDVAYNRKLESEQAAIRFQDYQQTTNVSSVIYHEIFVPSNGKEFRTKREHPKLCSLAFDFRQDSTLTADCERTLGESGLQKATSVIFIGNHPIFKVFNSFLPEKTTMLPFRILMDDKNSQKKNKDYYRYPPVKNHDEWIKNKTYLMNEITESHTRKSTGGVIP